MLSQQRQHFVGDAAQAAQVGTFVDDRVGRSALRADIARQLGHRDVAMVAKVYSRFKPDTEERDRWQQAAAARRCEMGWSCCQACAKS